VVADLVLIALGVALQPFRLSAFILILSTEDGTKKGLGFILGWLTSLVLVIAVVVLITGGRPVRFRTVPSTVALIIKLALGIALIVFAAVRWRQRNRARRPATWLDRLDTMSAWAAAVIAAIMQPWTLVAAAAVTAAQARLSSAGDYLALASFCLLATSSFIVLELYAVFAPAASTQLAALRNWLDRRENELIIIVCLVLGAWLTGQSIRLLAVEGSGSRLNDGHNGAGDAGRMGSVKRPARPYPAGRRAPLPDRLPWCGDRVISQNRALFAV
jgi:Sap, sulfolipid-1-addressing protein